MRVLWFEITEPAKYVSFKNPIGGWQDSLERIVRSIPEIDLEIAFVSEKFSEVKVIEGVRYIPIKLKLSRVELLFKRYWAVYVKKVLPEVKRIVEDSKPDIIHIFGTEWPLGQVAAYTDVPVVIHIMGAVVPYNNANYPPGYSYWQIVHNCWWNPKTLFLTWREYLYRKDWERLERKTWQLVSNYMGRTQWDCSLSRIMHPERRYFHVDEALRLVFLTNKKWSVPNDSKIKLISIGCSTFWKGPDMMIKVARILSDLKIDYEWNVAGFMSDTLKQMIEKSEGVRFNECNINILGFVQPEELLDLLCSSTLYVHTAYIENSPNSICEAQCLGIPVVSTNVGGIATLVRNGEDGILVPANDPWQMADAIIELSKDKNRLLRYSENNRKLALVRHNDENIKKQLLECYNSLINEISG